jgi:hypothetical protein
MRAASLLLLTAFSAPPDFAGCSSGSNDPSSPRPLPVDTPECTADSDCAIDACSIGRCRLGTCQIVAVTDDDRDGAFPPPCGTDCDDARPEIFEGAPERCNQRDEDCDGTTDEGAPPRDEHVITTSDPFGVGVHMRSLLLPGGEGALLAHDGESGGELFVQAVGVEGALGPRRLVGFFGGYRVIGGVRRANGTYVLEVHDIWPQWVSFELSDAGTLFDLSPPTVFLADDLSNPEIEMASIGDGYAVVYDRATRFVRFGFTGAPIEVSPSPTLGEAPSIATDGEHVVVPDPAEDTLVFFRDGGGVAARVPHPAAYRPRVLASGDGVVYLEAMAVEPALSAIAADGTVTTVPLRDPGPHSVLSVGRMLVIVSYGEGGSLAVSVLDPRTGEIRAGPMTTLGGFMKWSAVPMHGGIAVSSGNGELLFFEVCGSLT